MDFDRPGGESWPYLDLSFDRKQEYEEAYRTWNPRGFDAEEWMRLFKNSGLRILAFTAKHHDGFSMFDTHNRVRRRVNWTAPSIVGTPFGRDVVRELCDAALRHDVKIDLNFSHPDVRRGLSALRVLTDRHPLPGRGPVA